MGGSNDARFAASPRLAIFGGRPSSIGIAPYLFSDRRRGPRIYREPGLPPSIDIEPLLRRVAERDERAVAELYDATARYVFGILRRMLRSVEAAEEVSQDVYLQVWRKAGAFDPNRASAWSWLALLTRSRAIDRMRSEGSYRDVVDELEREPLASPRGNPGHDPEQQAARSERAEKVRSAVGELPPDQRKTLEMAFFGGLTHREIAEVTSTPLGTVKSRIRSSLQVLGERLEEGLR